MTPPFRCALSIAGSDPSGGAGVQADLKTFTSLGVYGCAAITCITVQNTRGVQDAVPLAPELVQAQVTAVLDDMPVTQVKIGMLGTQAIAEAVADALRGFHGLVVLDPIWFASDGHPLFHGEHRGRLLGLASVLTPNRDELAALTGLTLSGPDQGIEAARRLLDEWDNLDAVVVKGGHFTGGEVIDTLVRRDPAILGGIRLLGTRRHRVETDNTHGTGCTFSAALCAGHLLTGDLDLAFSLASDYLGELLAASAGLTMGRGRGGLCHWRHHRPGPTT